MNSSTSTVAPAPAAGAVAGGEAGGRRRSGSVLGLAALALAGCLLATMPHLMRWAATGDWTYFPDDDELLYLSWTRGVVLDGDASMGDAVHRASGPMMHPWLIFVPPDLLGHALGLGTHEIGILWRALAGAGIAL